MRDECVNMDEILLEKIEKATKDLAALKKQGNLHKEMETCRVLARLHERIGLQERPGCELFREHSGKALQFWRSVLEISGEFSGQRREVGAAVEVANLLIVGGACGDADAFLEENGALFGEHPKSLVEVLITKAGHHSRRPGEIGEAFFALEEAKSLTSSLPCDADSLLLLARIEFDMSLLLERLAIELESGELDQSSLELLQSAHSNVQLIRESELSVLATLTLKCTHSKILASKGDDLGAAFVQCLEGIDLYRKDVEGNSQFRPRLLVYCELLLLAGRLYGLVNDHAQAETNLLLAKEEAREAMAPFWLVQEIESEISQTLERKADDSLIGKDFCSKVPKQIRDLTIAYFKGRDSAIKNELKSQLTIWRLDDPKTHPVYLKYDQKFSYFVNRKVTSTAMKIFGRDMNLAAKTSKKKSVGLELKRARRAASNNSYTTSATKTVKKSKVIVIDSDSDSFINDSPEEGDEDDDTIECLSQMKVDDHVPVIEPLSTPKSIEHQAKTTAPRNTIDHISITDQIASKATATSSTSDPIALKTTAPTSTTSPILTISTSKTIKQPQLPYVIDISDTPKKNNILISPSSPLFIFDSPVIQPTKPKEKKSPRITILFEDNNIEGMIVPLSGLKTVSDLISRCQERLQSIHGRKTKIESLLSMPSRARLFPEDALIDVLTEQDQQLLAILGKPDQQKPKEPKQTENEKEKLAAVLSSINNKIAYLAASGADERELSCLKGFQERLQPGEKINLSRLKIRSREWKIMLPLLLGWIKASGCKCLDLSFNFLTETDVQLLLNQSQRVEQLVLTGNPLTKIVAKNIKHLDVSFTLLRTLTGPVESLVLCDGTLGVLDSSLLSSLKNLEISLRTNQLAILNQISTSRLHKLHLKEATFTGNQVLESLSMMPELRSLKLSKCLGVQLASLGVFMRRMGGCLESLVMEGCTFEGGDWFSLFELAERDCFQLKEIVILRSAVIPVNNKNTYRFKLILQ